MLKILTENYCFPKNDQIVSSGGGAITWTGAPPTGWGNMISCECRQIPPSALERGNPYFRSPLMCTPQAASWALIW